MILFPSILINIRLIQTEQISPTVWTYNWWTNTNPQVVGRPNISYYFLLYSFCYLVKSFGVFSLNFKKPAQVDLLKFLFMITEIQYKKRISRIYTHIFGGFISFFHCFLWRKWWFWIKFEFIFFTFFNCVKTWFGFVWYLELYLLTC